MRIALGVEYAGTDFSGWQSQAGRQTVQATLEKVLSRIASHPVRVVCAGRTDTGVHATGQVVHFDTGAARPLRAWVAGSNSLLPESVVVRWAEEVDTCFHARFSALSRSYRYIIYNTQMHGALTSGRATWYRYPLDTDLMQQATVCLLGEQDFSSFRSSECESTSPMRCMHDIEVTRQGDFVIIDLTANAFLHHMVRNIAGVLLRVGAGFKSPGWVAEVLAAQDRRVAAETVRAAGLYLVRVTYPAPWLFPLNQNVILF